MNKRKHNQLHQDGPKQKSRNVKKPPKMPHFWIRNCHDTKRAPEGKPYDIEILVTRAVLEDDYKPKAKFAAHSMDDIESTDTTTAGAASGTQPAEEKDTQLLPWTKNDEPRFGPALAPAPSVVKLVGSNVAKKESVSNDSCTEGKDEDRTQILVGVKTSNNAKKPLPKVRSDCDWPCLKLVPIEFYLSRLKYSHFEENFKPLPDGDCGDGILNPHPKDEVPDKYWSQRHRFFTLFNDGIQLDKESWYSVTPEKIATHIAEHLVGDGKDIIVLDPFCGCGGNAIAFARQSGVKQVICVDLDLTKLEKAHHNASIYGVEQKLLLVHGNAIHALSMYSDGKLIQSDSSNGVESFSKKSCPFPTSIDAIFLSPPWGGSEYGNVGKDGFNLKFIKIDAGEEQPFDGEHLLDFAAKASGHRKIAHFLPKNINGIKFAESVHKAGFPGPVVMEKNYLNGKLKTVTSYLGLGA